MCADVQPPIRPEREAGGLDQLGATAALRNENGTALPGRRQRGARDTVVAHDGVVAVAVDVQVAVWAEDEADARRGQPAAPGRHEVSAGLTRARQRRTRLPVKADDTVGLVAAGVEIAVRAEDDGCEIAQPRQRSEDDQEGPASYANPQD